MNDLGEREGEPDDDHRQRRKARCCPSGLDNSYLIQLIHNGSIQ